MTESARRRSLNIKRCVLFRQTNVTCHMLVCHFAVSVN